MTFEQAVERANKARVPYHDIVVEMVNDKIYIGVEGIEDNTATHVVTRKALNRVGDSIGIPDDIWISGKFSHSGMNASVFLPFKLIAELR